MRLIDADAVNMIKFHPLPYTHIVPADLLKCQTEAYERGWNDAIDAIIENAETIEERKTGRWIKDRLTALNGGSYEVFRCSECQSAFNWRMGYCGHCGAKMEDDDIPMEYFENGGI